MQKHFQQYSSGRRPTIALFADNLNSGGYHIPIWSGLIDTTRREDINLISVIGEALSQRKEEGSLANLAYELISPANVDGIVLMTGTLSANLTLEEMTAFCARYRPLPIASIAIALPGADNVLLDNYQSMRRIVKHLLDAHGYRQIAFYRKYEGHEEADQRYQAYENTLKEYDLPVRPELVISGSYYDNVQAGLRLLLDERKLRPGADIQAIIAVDDWTAKRILTELQARGVRVPEDIALTGFDDEADSQYLTPPLTTVRQPLYEQGCRALELVLNNIRNRRSPETVSLPAQMVARRSCGCPDTLIAISAASSAPLTTPEELSRADLLRRVKETISTHLLWSPDAEFMAHIEYVLNAFWNDAVSDAISTHSERFLPALEHCLQAAVKEHRDMVVWQWAVSSLRNGARQMPQDAATLARGDNLWHQACLMLGTYIQQAHTYERLAEQRTETLLQQLNKHVCATFDIPRLMDVLHEHLPQLDIPACYLALYDDPNAPLSSARMMLAYDERGRHALPVDGQQFPTERLMPDNLWPWAHAGHIVLEPLLFARNHIGFLLFQAKPSQEKICYELKIQVSTALQGALLIKNLQQRTAEIARQKYILDAFMANVPDSIYFKDRESRFIQVNTALARNVGIDDPAQLVGQSDFDLFSEEISRPAFAVEQHIIQTGEPMLAVEEFNGHGTWTLSSKIPLRDENGDIIGTFGISRDITPLKRAQQQVEEAYEEIRKLNEQLKLENLRMSAELDVARRLQQMVLPMPEELGAISGLEIVGYMQPADEVGGDYYDVLHCQQGRVCIGIGDVTGHGLESGVLMLMTQTAIRTLVDRGETDPVVFLNTINRVLYQNIQRMGVDRSLTLAMVNYQQGQLRLIGQHEEALIVRYNGQIERMDTINLGFPIGMVDDIRQWIAEATVTLSAGDGVVLYTDGITEAQNTANEFYGLERLCAVIGANWRDATAEAVKQAIIEDVQRFIGSEQMYDDMTLIVLKQQSF